MTAFNSYDTTNEVILKGLELDNYRVYNHKRCNNLCYIYCSSNGLYEVNNKQSFEKVILDNDKFEWENRTAKCKPRKEIFIRDIHLSWYVNGISNKHPTIESLVEWLKDETKGYEVVVVGISSGGYIANILSVELNAKMTFSISSQFSLIGHNNHVNDNKLLQLGLSRNERYYENYQMVKNSNAQIVYLYPNGVDHDCDQAKYVDDLSNVFSLSFNSDVHGKVIHFMDLPYFISLDKKEIEELVDKIGKTNLEQCQISNWLHGRWKTHYLKICFYISRSFIRGKRFIRKIVRKLSS